MKNEKKGTIRAVVLDFKTAYKQKCKENKELSKEIVFINGTLNKYKTESLELQSNLEDRIKSLNESCSHLRAELREAYENNRKVDEEARFYKAIIKKLVQN